MQVGGFLVTLTEFAQQERGFVRKFHINMQDSEKRASASLAGCGKTASF
jgi:hypothetical protein